MSRLILRGLEARQREGRPVRVGVMGAGEFGRALVTQLAQAPGMLPAAVADLDPRLAHEALLAAGYRPEQIREAGSGAAGRDAVAAGGPVVLPDGALLADLPLDVVVDSTGSAVAGADVGARCLRAGQHLVMVNVEADVTAGAALRRIADTAGVVYTLADGDQPSLICTLADWATSLGLEVLSGGKGTALYPPDHPRRREVETAPLPNLTGVAYMDGSKSQIEMAAAANVLGWGIDVRGLHHPSARLEEVATLFGPRESGGLFARTPVIDFVNCRSADGETEIEPHLGHGVFVVATGHPEALRAMGHKGVPLSADGSRALLWRPFHLVGVETPFSVAQAALFGVATASPLPAPSVEVIAVAKGDLPAGAQLDGIGGRAVRGEAESAAVATASRLLPIGLADGVRLARAVPAGTPLTYDHLEAPGESACWRLRGEHGLLAAAPAP
jgi:predicted homoserine dehydrogenase-like protein